MWSIHSFYQAFSEEGFSLIQNSEAKKDKNVNLMKPENFNTKPQEGH